MLGLQLRNDLLRRYCRLTNVEFLWCFLLHRPGRWLRCLLLLRCSLLLFHTTAGLSRCFLDVLIRLGRSLLHTSIRLFHFLLGRIGGFRCRRLFRGLSLFLRGRFLRRIILFYIGRLRHIIIITLSRCGNLRLCFLRRWRRGSRLHGQRAAKQTSHQPQHDSLL